MQRILLVTDKPNKEASTLTHSELFDLTKNSFSQFFGRLLLGNEQSFRKHFNNKNFLWMHARGSRCHGDTNQDGKLAILKQVQRNDFPLIVTFGSPGLHVFIDKDKANLGSVIPLMSNGPVSFEKIKNLLNDELRNNPPRSQLACFPHPSGNSQWVWMGYPHEISDCLLKVQEFILTYLDESN